MIHIGLHRYEVSQALRPFLFLAQLVFNGCELFLVLQLDVAKLVAPLLRDHAQVIGK